MSKEEGAMTGAVKLWSETLDNKNKRIATLEAELKARDLAIKCLLEGKKELEVELAVWQQNYANQMRNPKQRQAYLAQLEKRKERG